MDLEPLPAQLLGGGLQDLLLAAGDGDPGAVMAEDAADLLADTGGAAGDEGDLAGEQIGPEGRARRLSSQLPVACDASTTALMRSSVVRIPLRWYARASGPSPSNTAAAAACSDSWNDSVTSVPSPLGGAIS